MKKNKMMRLASVLLVLTLLTTGIIGGTLAKYVTDGSGTDTARIAKFGVVAAVSGDLFGSTYAKADGNTIVSYSTDDATVKADGVSADDADNVVAPGTKNEKGMTLSVSGTPEVSTQVILGNAKKDGKEYDNSDIYLAKGDYGVMVEYEGKKTTENIVKYYTKDADGVYTKATESTPLNTSVYELRGDVSFADDYHPLIWKIGGVDTGTLENVTIELKKKFHGVEASGGAKNFGTYAPNTPISVSSATVTWEWPFQKGSGDSEQAINDKKDTILGDMIAGSAVVKKDSGDSYTTVKYVDIPSGADGITVAYTGDTVPTDLDTATNICACLTASFGASLTVEQVD